MKKCISILFICILSSCLANKTPCGALCANSKDFAYLKNVSTKYSTELSYLLMNFFEDGMDYAMVIDGKKVPSKNKQKFNPGVRVTFGLPFSRLHPRDRKIELSWTYIKMKTSSDTGVMNTIHNLFLPPQFLTSSRASASLSGDFNTFNLNFVKPYYVSKCYIAYPSMGIKGALIDQDLKVIYTIVNTLNTATAKNDYWGVGLQAGYGSDFIISSHYSIYAKTLVSLLWGRTKVSQSSDIPITLLSQYNLKEKSYNVLPNAEIAFGLSFDQSFSQNKKISVKVGYELHHLWGQNQLKKFMSSDPVAVKSVARNNLKFNGLNFSLLFKY